MTGSQKLYFYVSLTAFLFLNFAIFNPLLKCDLPFTGHFLCLITALLCSYFVCVIFARNSFFSNSGTAISKILSPLCAALSIFCVVLLMTQVISETCFIVGKGVSTSYYFIMSLCLLFCCFITCSKGKNAIFRFCCISASAVILFTVVCFLPFTAIKDISTDLFTFQRDNKLLQSAFWGAISGLFLSFDCAVFFYCSQNSFAKDSSLTKITLLSVITAFILLLCTNGCVYLILGKELTLSLNRPYFALAKCFRGFDLTEIVPAIAIFAFIAKCPVYLCSASIAVKNAFFPSSPSKPKAVLYVIFLSIPAIYLPFLLFGQGYSYGALQPLIYPALPVMSLLFVLLHIFEK